MTRSSGRILITGGLGYIGGRLAKSLREAFPGRDIRLLTRRDPDARPPWARSFDVFQADLSHAEQIAPGLKSVETVIHLAAMNEMHSAESPIDALDVTVGGTLRLIEAARRAKIRRILYLSTIHAYGPAAGERISENRLPRPVHPYAITHLSAEDFIAAAALNREMESLIFRYSNGYGCPADPGVDRWTLVFLDLCRQAIHHGALRLTSSGLAHRDFVSLEDLNRAIILALEWPSADWRGDIYNVGGECSMSIMSLAEKISREYAEIYGETLPLSAKTEKKQAKHPPVLFDISKLKARGYAPRHPWSEEIRATLKMSERAPFN